MKQLVVERQTAALRPRPARWLIDFVMVGFISFLPGSIATASPPRTQVAPSSQAESFIRAGKPTSNDWTRETLLRVILENSNVETREQISALFGPPNYTVEVYHAGVGLTDRFDTYRLSAKNDRSYSVSYNSSGEILHQGIENRPCGCPSCEKAAKVASAALPAQTASGFLATLKNAPSVRQVLSAIELSVGSHGVSTIDLGVQVGGRAWANYSVVWPIADDDHRFFMATGSVPMADYAPGKDLPMDSYSLIAVANECLGR
jgi:hypothetical protein